MSDFLKKYYPSIKRKLHESRIECLKEILEEAKEEYKKDYKEDYEVLRD